MTGSCLSEPRNHVEGEIASFQVPGFVPRRLPSEAKCKPIVAYFLIYIGHGHSWIEAFKTMSPLTSGNLRLTLLARAQ